MTPLVWATIALCAVAALLVVGIPYWITFMRPNHVPDHSDAHAYLAAKTVMAEGALPDQPAPLTRLTSVGTTPIGRPRSRQELDRPTQAA